MGPRPIGRGNYDNNLLAVLRDKYFNGAAADWPRKQAVRSTLEALAQLLQWGRGRLAAETHCRPIRDPLLTRTSMGPRPIGRGNNSDFCGFRTPISNFNGAAADWPRKLRISAARSTCPRELQWGRGRLAAETGGAIRLTAKRSINFNGAAADWPRKLGMPPVEAGVETRTSMGPRPIGRGNGRTEDANRNLPRTSMGPRPIGRGNPRGAAMYRAVLRTSMGPRPIGRGNCGRVHLHGAGGNTSMGPRPIGRGNQGGAPGVSLRYYTLQWGRGRLAAETRPVAVTMIGAKVTSMGPRPIGRGNLGNSLGNFPLPPLLQWGRGRLAAETRCGGAELTTADRASMGPRPIGRGNHGRRAVRHVLYDTLQWGRGRLAAETTGPRGRRSGRPELQWGRGRLAAETWSSGPCSPCPAVDFNGAAADWPRKQGGGAAQSRDTILTSMGPRPIGRGNRRGWVTYGYQCVRLQWGRGRLAAET